MINVGLYHQLPMPQKKNAYLTYNLSGLRQLYDETLIQLQNNLLGSIEHLALAEPLRRIHEIVQNDINAQVT